MLNCKLCDYYRSLPATDASHSHAAKCEFSGVSFFEDVENVDMEYPCRRIRFLDYLRAKQRPQAERNVYKLMSEDWRYVYLKGHVKESARRTAQTA